MASLVIRNLDDRLKERLRLRAARHGHSMEEEVRIVLRRVLESDEESATDLAELARALFGKEGGVDLEAHPAVPVRAPPELGA